MDTNTTYSLQKSLAVFYFFTINTTLLMWALKYNYSNTCTTRFVEHAKPF